MAHPAEGIRLARRNDENRDDRRIVHHDENW